MIFQVIIGSTLLCKVLEYLSPDDYKPTTSYKTLLMMFILLFSSFLFLYLLQSNIGLYFYWRSLFFLDNDIGTVAQVSIAFVINALVLYVIHIAMHKFKWLWWIHKSHHSIQSISMLMGFLANPLEPIANSMGIMLVDYGLLGINPQCVMLTSYLINFLVIFLHSNIKTPHWLGYFIQRPEMHKLHHTYQHHQDNYTYLPWIDMLFGTYQNKRPKVYTFGLQLRKSRSLN